MQEFLDKEYKDEYQKDYGEESPYITTEQAQRLINSALLEEYERWESYQDDLECKGYSRNQDFREHIDSKSNSEFLELLLGNECTAL